MTVRRAGLAPLALALALALPPAPGAAAEPPDRTLTVQEQRIIDNHLEVCAEVGVEARDIAEHIAKMVAICAERGNEAIDYLIERGLAHQDDQARVVAVETLARVGNPRALPALNRMVEFDGNYTVRRFAARAVAGFGDSEALHQLFAELPDLDGSLRRRLLSPPGEAPERAAARRKRLSELAATIDRALDRFEALAARMAGNVDPDEQQLAKRELQHLTGDVNRDAPDEWRAWWDRRGGVPPPLHAFVNTTADRTTMIALIELAALTDARAAERGLTFCLRNGETTVRMAAAEALGSLAASGPEDFRGRAAGLLRSALADRDGWVKISAARALAACGPAGAEDAFHGLLADWAPEDKSPAHRMLLQRVRRAAVIGLRKAGAAGGAGIGRFRGEFAAMLLDPESDRMLRWELCSALADVGDLSSLPALARCATGKDEDECRKAFDSIGLILKRAPEWAGAEGARTDGDLVRTAAGRDVALAVAAVWELDRRGAATARPALLEELSGATAEARLFAVAALALRRWSPAVRSLAETAAGSGGSAELVAAACRAVVDLGDQRQVARFLASPERPPQLTEFDMTDRRRRAAMALIRLLEAGPGEAPAGAAGHAATALAAVMPDQNPTLWENAIESLVRAIVREGPGEAGDRLGAALRALSGEDFPDRPEPWREWWEARMKARQPEE